LKDFFEANCADGKWDASFRCFSEDAAIGMSFRDQSQAVEVKTRRIAKHAPGNSRYVPTGNLRLDLPATLRLRRRSQWIFNAVLERAKGFEPSTPTLAR
jgi:hypothetical protein